MSSTFSLITMPSTLEQIGNYSFRSMPNLSALTIPASVTSIGQYVCRDDAALLSVTILATTPPTLPSSHGFLHGSNNAKIYVPSTSVDTYKSAAGWSDYASRIFAIQ